MHPGAAQPVARASIEKLIAAGIDDWGGVSPVTPDHVNPEAPWPQIEALAQRTAATGKVLVQRLPVYPAYAFDAGALAATPASRTRVLRAIDAEGLARDDDWAPGLTVLPKPRAPMLRARRSARSRRGRRARRRRRAARRSRDRARCSPRATPTIEHVIARGRRAAPGGQRRRRALRRQPQHQLHQHLLLTAAGSAPSPRARRSEELRGAPYDLALDEIVRRVARGLGARRDRSLHAGRHPSRLHRRDLSRHLPRDQGGAAATCTCTPSRRWRSRTAPRRSGCRCATFWRELQGRRARHACRAPRRKSSTTRCAPIICPDKVNTAQWLDVVRDRASPSACAPPRPSCSAMSSGRCIGRGICCVCATCRSETGGFTEFVPLPFVHMEAPIYLKRPARARARPCARRC